jgi:hypothetical protein
MDANPIVACKGTKFVGPFGIQQFPNVFASRDMRELEPMLHADVSAYKYCKNCTRLTKLLFFLATFTYEMSISVNNMEGMAFDFNELRNDASDSYLNFVTVTKEALDKAFLSTDIKRQFQGAEVMKVKSELVTNAKISSLDPKISVEFLVQVTLASITLYTYFKWKFFPIHSIQLYFFRFFTAHCKHDRRQDQEPPHKNS